MDDAEAAKPCLEAHGQSGARRAESQEGDVQGQSYGPDANRRTFMMAESQAPEEEKKGDDVHRMEGGRREDQVPEHWGSDSTRGAMG